jgi:predicted nucleic acid-binding protein
VSLIVVIDASAAVEYLLQTSVGMRAAVLIDDADVAAPELLDAEVLAAFVAKSSPAGSRSGAPRRP